MALRKRRGSRMERSPWVFPPPVGGQVVFDPSLRRAKDVVAERQGDRHG